MEFFIADAFAQGGGQQGGMATIIMLVAIFAIFYFVLIRPQAKRQKEHRAMISALGKGDEVVTNGGLLGRITRLDEAFVTLEVDGKGTRVLVQRPAVAIVMPKGTIKSAVGGHEGKSSAKDNDSEE